MPELPLEVVSKLTKLAELFDFSGEIDGSVCLKIKGELRIISDKDIVLISGQEENIKRAGYNHAIWLNPPLNEKMEPQLILTVKDLNTNTDVDIPALFNEEGRLDYDKMGVVQNDNGGIEIPLTGINK